MKKKITITFIFIFTVTFFFLLNVNLIEKKIPKKIKEIIPWTLVEYYYEIKNFSLAINKYNYLYNTVFLPETHFANFKYIEKNIYFKENKIKKKIFFFEKNESIYFTTSDGEFYETSGANLIRNERIQLNLIENNLKNFFKSKYQIIDNFFYDDYFYVAIVHDGNNKKTLCKKFSIYRSYLLDELNFKKMFTYQKCAENQISGGRMQIYQQNNKKYLIFSLADVGNDKINDGPQSLDSYYGKIISIDLENLESEIFSLGHRNIQGLLVHKNTIISTEHGPRGGDEINIILKDKNYGWPISSYGKPYFDKNIKYFNNHEKQGFEEPIYSFIKGIGISEIIHIPKNFFNSNMENLFFVSSLFGRSIFLLKFDKKYSKIVFNEKIYIGKRIRDLFYSKKNNTVFLSLENPTKIGILKK